MLKAEGAVAEKPKFESTLTALVAHPTRVAAWRILVERVASPTEIAHELKKEVGHVGYHVRKLAELELVELVDERPVRGAVEHFYKAIERPFCDEEEWANMTPEQRDAITRQTLQAHVADVAEAVHAGTFDSKMSRMLVRLPMQDMDDEGFDEIKVLVDQLYEGALDVLGNVANRKAADETNFDGFPGMLTVMNFERPTRGA